MLRHYGAFDYVCLVLFIPICRAYVNLKYGLAKPHFFEEERVVTD